MDADNSFADSCLSKVSQNNHEMMLDLSLTAPKSSNIFTGSDQTPTPTRLIRNCEEVGLFDDLRHVNPFDETFRRAVEQNTGKISASPAITAAGNHPEEESLHTPQVFPQLETESDCGGFRNCEMLQKTLESPSAGVALDASVVDDLLKDVGSYKLTSRQNSNSSSYSGYGRLPKYRKIAEKTQQSDGGVAKSAQAVALPTSIQLIQPQIITLTFPSNVETVTSSKPSGLAATAIPVQTVKPFILPKPAQQTKQPTSAETQPSQNMPQLPHEPSSASLTPTSQLPIKERLKAILIHSSKTHMAEAPAKTLTRHSRHSQVKSQKQHDDDCIERRRAAATRYRNKMRNEHKELRRRNAELQADNEKLREHIKKLEQQMAKQQTLVSANGAGSVHPAQIQIPPATVHLVMNIPKLLVNPHGQPILQNPITYKVERK